MSGGCNLEPLPVFGSTQHRLGTLMLLPLMLHSRSEWDSKDCNFAQPSIGASPNSPTHTCTISTFSCSLSRPVQEIDLGCKSHGKQPHAYAMRRNDCGCQYELLVWLSEFMRITLSHIRRRHTSSSTYWQHLRTPWLSSSPFPIRHLQMWPCPTHL